MSRKLLAGFGLLLLSAVLIVVFALLSHSPPKPKKAHTAVKIVEWGRTDKYGYVVLDVQNGTLNASLCAGPLVPARRLVVLSQDYTGSGRLDEALHVIENISGRCGVSMITVERAEELLNMNDSFILIPSGAMPSALFPYLKNLSRDNILLFIGMTNLTYVNGSLRLEAWPNARVVVLSSSILEFLHSEQAQKKLSHILLFSSFTHCVPCVLSKRSTCTVELKKSDRFLLISWANRTERFALPRNRGKALGTRFVFPWQPAKMMFELEEPVGLVRYVVKRDGHLLERKILTMGEKGEVAYFVERFNRSGDYICSLEDLNGYVVGQYVHVYNVSLALTDVFGSIFRFKLLVDGQAPTLERVSVWTNQSAKLSEYDVINGVFEVRAEPDKPHVFYINFKGKVFVIRYKPKGQSVLSRYLKLFVLAALAWVGVLAGVRFFRRGIYRLRIPDAIPSFPRHMRIRKRDLLKVFDDVNKRFGWKKLPLTLEEVMAGLKHQLGEGVVLSPENVEEILLALEKEGVLAHAHGLWQPASWGDVRKNALRRWIRELLVAHGLKFKECRHGFETPKGRFFVEPGAGKEHAFLVVFDEADKREWLEKRPERFEVAIMLKNGRLSLITLKELNEML